MENRLTSPVTISLARLADLDLQPQQHPAFNLQTARLLDII